MILSIISVTAFTRHIHSILIVFRIIINVHVHYNFMDPSINNYNYLTNAWYVLLKRLQL